MATANDLNISQSGIVAFDGIATFSGRTLTAGTGVSITNADGVAGNPVISATGGSGITTVGDVTSGSVAFDGTIGTTLTSTSSGLTLTVANAGSGAGGGVSLISGTSTAGNGGNITATAANGTGGTTVGGNVILTAGNSVSFADGGHVTITGGVSGGAGLGGFVSLIGGAGGTSGNGGAANLKGGASTAAVGGAVAISGGNTTGTGAVAGGAVTISGGSAAGTNAPSSTVTVSNGSGTGTGLVGQMVFKADVAGGTTGTTAHNQVARLTLNGSKQVLTSGSATTILSATTTGTANFGGGGTIDYLVEASDGTAFQCTTGTVAWAVTRTGSVNTGTATILGGEVTHTTTGTLTNTFAVVGSGTIYNLQITPTTSLTATILRVTYQVSWLGQLNITVPTS